MTSPAADKDRDREQIRALLECINDAWLKNPPEKIPALLQEHFHPDMTIKGPDFQSLCIGSEFCARSYAEFARTARVKECSFSDPDIDLAGDAAVATYSWKMVYEIHGQEYNESGRDLFVMSRTKDRWVVIWRALLAGMQ